MKHEQDKQLLQSQVDASTNSLMAVIGERDQLRMKWDGDFFVCLHHIFS